MTVFFVTQDGSDMIVTRDDHYPFLPYMEQGLRRLPAVARVVNDDDRLVIELKDSSTLTVGDVREYVNAMARDHLQQQGVQDTLDIVAALAGVTLVILKNEQRRRTASRKSATVPAHRSSHRPRRYAFGVFVSSK